MTDDEEKALTRVMDAMLTQAQRLDYGKFPVPVSTLAEWLRWQVQEIAKVAGVEIYERSQPPRVPGPDGRPVSDGSVS